MKGPFVRAATLVFASACHSQQSTAITPIPSGSGGTAAVSAGPASDPSPISTTPSVDPSPSASLASAHTWTFDGDSPGGAPTGFSFGRTGQGREGKWLVRAAADAPSGGNVLAQADADTTDYRFPVAWAKNPTLADLELSVRCKPVSGEVDEACGLVFRLRDANNYYLTRANAAENNVRLYVVKDGLRQQIASYSGKVTRGAWHSYRARVEGDHIEVFWEGTKALDHHDKTFSEAGKVGVWTKADSVTEFDDLSVKPL